MAYVTSKRLFEVHLTAAEATGLVSALAGTLVGIPLRPGDVTAFEALLAALKEEI